MRIGITAQDCEYQAAHKLFVILFPTDDAHDFLQASHSHNHYIFVMAEH